MQRGIHDIENEMVFRDRPEFIFHDSRGFEAGGVDEMKKVKAFISEHAKAKRLQDQIHAIWCVICSKFLRWQVADGLSSKVLHPNG